jgi:lipopolysaccharide transport system ATP-binding protein
MKRHEIDRKYDEIVTFAKLEKFMDTPVKRYSSGMFVRLAFSVAAHLESEILIIDEILAVGDHAFQDKCIGKMKDVSSKGRTVLFVSHNIQLIRKLCQRAILLDNGVIEDDGLTLNVVKKYHGQNMQIEITKDSFINDSKFRRGSGLARLNEFKIIDEHGVATTTFNTGETISFFISFITNDTINGARISICFCSELLKEPIFYLNHTICEEKLKDKSQRTAIIRFNTKSLCAGSFHLWLGLQDQSRQNLDIISDILPVINLKSVDGALHELGCVNLPSTAQRL